MSYRTSALWGRCPKREKKKTNRNDRINATTLQLTFTCRVKNGGKLYCHGQSKPVDAIVQIYVVEELKRKCTIV